MIIILIGILVVTLLYWIVVQPLNYWKSRNVICDVSDLPFLSDFWRILIGKHFTTIIDNTYQQYPTLRYKGTYFFGSPTLFIKDPELIKQVCIKDFEHFVDHRTMFDEEIEPLMSGNLISLTGQKWKDMRTTLSPSFTSSKMKGMFFLMVQSCKQFVSYFLDKNEPIVHVQLKDAYTRFSNDVIANIVFGVECNSLKDQNNEFYVNMKAITNFSGLWKNMKFLVIFMFPRLAKFLKLSWLGNHVTNFFRKIVADNMEYRTKHNIVRPDILHLLMQAREGKSNFTKAEKIEDGNFAAVEEHLESNESSIKRLTDDQITSQALLFFFAGFEPVSTVMCFLSYELATNPDIQNKLFEEINNNQTLNGDLTYEALNKLTYLDMVLTETLRKWPVSVATDRVCTKSYTIQPVTPEEKPVHLKPKDNIMLPLWPIHRDPKYYPNPEKFDPERFLPEKRNNLIPYTYLPFGIGPRNCIGSRFALIKIKAVIYYIILNFEIVPTEESKILVLDKRNLNLTAEDGFKFGFQRRKLN